MIRYGIYTIIEESSEYDVRNGRTKSFYIDQMDLCEVVLVARKCKCALECLDVFMYVLMAFIKIGTCGYLVWE